MQALVFEELHNADCVLAAASVAHCGHDHGGAVPVGAACVLEREHARAHGRGLESEREAAGEPGHQLPGHQLQGRAHQRHGCGRRSADGHAPDRREDAP